MTECIFCSGECTCTIGAPVARKKKVGKPTRKSLAPALESGTNTQAPPVAGKPEHAALSTELSPEEIDFRACMRVLAPILCEDDRDKITHILSAEPSHEERIYSLTKERTVEQERINEAWRARSTTE